MKITSYMGNLFIVRNLQGLESKALNFFEFLGYRKPN